jgi:hypothetical protein
MRKRQYRLQIHPWSAVRLLPDAAACPKAQALREKRFLGREAPSLPLKGCSRSLECNCKYLHYADRRDAPRRATASSAGVLRTAHERRSERGRRGSD